MSKIYSLLKYAADYSPSFDALTLASVGYVDTKFASAISAKKISVTNPQLVPSSGICTWQIPNTISSDVVVQVSEVSSGNAVVTDINITAANITVTFNASANIVAGTYKVVAIGI